jgi:hypothetical protein
MHALRREVEINLDSQLRTQRMKQWAENSLYLQNPVGNQELELS